MEKIVVGPTSKGVVDLDAPVRDNLKAVARRLERDVTDLVVLVLTLCSRKASRSRFRSGS